MGGTLSESKAGGRFEIGVSYKMSRVLPLRITGALCGHSTKALPFSMGQISIFGLACPHAAGPFELTAEVTLSDSIQLIHFASTSTLRFIASGGSEVLCAKIETASAEKSSSEVQDTVQ